MSADPRISRRELFTGWWQRAKAAADAMDAPAAGAAPAGRRVAVVQGRHCLAYRNLVCTSCYEACPEPGAIRIEGNLPVVDRDRCTGCGDCREVCPAPTNAMLLLPDRREVA